MSIIATLKPTETASPGNAYAIASIPLSKLVPWDGNFSKTGAGDALEELTASIAAHGVLQSLVVRKAQRGKYAIVAGRRRFLALSALGEGGTIEADAPVPCRVIPGSADATEISLTENVVRAPMHPADQSESQIVHVIQQAEAGIPIDELLRKYGISQATFYAWRKKFAGMNASEAMRLKQLEEENGRLKRVVAELTLDKQILQDVLAKKL